MGAKLNESASPATVRHRDDWAPRLAQLARLNRLEALLKQDAGGETAIAAAVERAVLLAALDRREEAKLAFIAILQKAPTHFSALNEFGTLLTEMGAIDAACRVYAEAILHHPQNPVGHVNFANLLLRASKYKEARRHYEAVLEIDPDHAPAHQGLGAVLADLGERDAAREHFRKGFRGRAISTLPYRGSAAPVRLVQLVSSGGGNIPTALFLDDTRFQTTVVVADHLEASEAPPPHDLIFNAIGDADLCEDALLAACHLTAAAEVPVINDPHAVMKTGRLANSEQLRTVPDVRTARTIVVDRSLLAGPGGADLLAGCGLTFPLLLRSPGYHTGRNFVLVQERGELAAAAAGLPGEALFAIEYLDARGPDGKARKYRVMMIGGRLYPLHLAISAHWKVHYFTSDMADKEDHRQEEARFLTDMPSVIGAKAMHALAGIRDTLGLDYAGVDFGLDSNGNLLPFEANATMVIAKPGPEPHWAYRHAAVERILAAVTEMMMAKAGATPLARAAGSAPSPSP
ncbi:tetratricopeptide repeat protein [Bradyrhizobium sp. Tv2a-2]|uniref:tetratricopeptide repeat protein n=1 Tax=Bradyrhizobium sp. Tv2a-2 TaxID=113395 RepID=UPI00040094C0|nr:tetratricopeptide repeat protein [Bradyrhizobium sp. Tv2a-2]